MLLTTASTKGAEMLYVSIQADTPDQGKNSIETFTLSGNRSVFANTASINPRGVAFDRAGNLYVASAIWNRIEKFTPDGVGSVFATTGLSSPFGLAFDRAGNLFVANYDNHTIQKFTPDGIGSVFATSGLSNPFGLAIDSQDNLYVANWGDGTIQKFTPDGVGSTFANLGTTYHLTGLAVDKADNLYVPLGNTIQKFTSSGVRSVFATTIWNPSLLKTPFGLAVDSAGNVYVANQAGYTISKFTPAGVGSIFAGTGATRPEFIAIRSVPDSILISSGSSGVRSNGFGFNVTAVSDRTVVVETSGNLYSPNWLPLQTNPPGTGSFYFSDPTWTNSPARFYRVRTQ